VEPLTVVGFMPVVELPHSELKIRIGLMMMAPHHKTEIKGRGIFSRQGNYSYLKIA
jgi:hypothetical protein